MTAYDRRAPQEATRTAAQGLGRAAAAGTSYQRQPSARVPGMAYYDTTLSEFVDSNGTYWQDRVGPSRVGNLLGPNMALVTLDATAWASQANSTITRSRLIVPPGRTTSLKIVSQASGLMQVYTLPNVAVTTTDTYSGYCRSFYAVGAARTFYMQISWFTSGSSYISSSAGSATSTGSGVWTPSLVVTATAPALAAQASLAVLVTTPAAAGETFYLTECCLAPGIITDYIEP